MQKDRQRQDFMTEAQWVAMAKAPRVPRTHANCLERTGVARPGKTAKDRWLRGRAK